MSDKRLTSEQRKAEILKSVSAIICSKGLNVTSRELSQAAGVSEALIFKLFGSKDGLYQVILEKSCQTHHPAGEQLSQLPPSTEVLVMAMYLLVHAIIDGIPFENDDFSLSPKETCGLLFQSLQTDGDIARRLFSQGFKPWIPPIIESMKVARKQNDITIEPNDFEESLWFSHHAVMGIKMTLHPDTPATMIASSKKDKLKTQILKFTLRGLGMKDKTINEKLKTATFIKFKKQLRSYND